MNSVRTLLLIVASILASAPAWSATTTIVASKDNTIYQNAANKSAGAAPGVFVGSNGSGSPRRGLLAFDIAANVPAGATVTGAELNMHLGNAPKSDPETISLHRLNVGWGEGTAGNAAAGIGGGGGGFAAGTGDATWNTPTFGSGAWTNPGGTGDFNAVASASTSVTGPVETGFTWLSTPALISDVQGWLDNPASNFGWALVNSDESGSATVKVFYSRSAAQNASGGPLDAAFRPMLTITYVPEPATLLTLLFAGPLAFSHRRR
jgi:hypothetical protein